MSIEYVYGDTIDSGVGSSNKDILDAIYYCTKSYGLEIRVEKLPPRQFDVPFNIIDSTKIIQKTGWEKTVSFEERIERTWCWLYHGHSIKKQN